jgi:hypothetical protein
MPGFAIDQISALSFIRETVELELPPLVFRSLGKPDLHLTWLRPSIFATALRTDPERAALRANYASLGTQVDLRFSVLHWYEMVLSGGYGAAYRGRRHVGNEWMISLKIM